MLRQISPQDSPKPPQALVFWILWFAILQGLVMMQYFIGGGIPKGSDQGNPPIQLLALAGGLAIAALAIRFTLIPRLKTISQKLPAMIIGLALSESIGILGMLVVGKNFPATQQVFLVTAIGCIVSFAPVYARERAKDGRF